MTEVRALEQRPDGIAVFEIGEAAPGAPTVLAAHGITSNSEVWVPAARALAGRARVIAFDMRGRGGSFNAPPPYGVSVHIADMLELLDSLELERPLLAGHSLGAYVISALASEHPDRAAGVLLVDGGLRIPGSEGVDPQEFAAALLGPTLERLNMHIESREAYRDWWRGHPALAEGQIAEEDLIAYADHDLLGNQPPFQCAVSASAVRADAEELPTMGATADQVQLPARLLSATRGLRNEPHPMHPRELVEQWVAARPETRRATVVEDSNHYTVAMGPRGAEAVASAVIELAAVAG